MHLREKVSGRQVNIWLHTGFEMFTAVQQASTGSR
jgi:hypothetical protein